MKWQCEKGAEAGEVERDREVEALLGKARGGAIVEAGAGRVEVEAGRRSTRRRKARNQEGGSPQAQNTTVMTPSVPTTLQL